MKVRDLIEELQKCDPDVEVQICSFHHDREELFHFGETYPGHKNVVACHLDSLSLIWQTSDKDGENKVVYLLDGGAAGNTVAYHLFKKVQELNVRCAKLDSQLAVINISFTDKHPNRNEKRAIEGVVFRSHKVDPTKSLVYAECINTRVFLNIIHHIDGNGIGTRDRIELPSYPSLQNLVEVLELLQNGK